MKIHHLRNATFILHLDDHRLLIDPMFGDVGVLPGFRLFRGIRRANPLVALPSGTETALKQVTGVVLTHQHPDHLDPTAIRWIKENQQMLYVHPQDSKALKKKGLTVCPFQENDLGLNVSAVATKHGPGLVGKLMGKGTGWLISGQEPLSIYLTGDTVWTPQVSKVLHESKPDVVVAPAGTANFGIGPDILFPLDELIKVAESAPGQVVFNHLEALDHCLLTRAALKTVLDQHQLSSKCIIPQDGDLVELPHT